MKDNSLFQFVRDRKGHPRGVVVATLIDNQVRYGWSYTNTKAGDRFNKQLGIHIALGRIDNGWGANVNIPHSVVKVLNRMANRVEGYYKVKSA
jgi:hypothetical protein